MATVAHGCEVTTKTLSLRLPLGLYEQLEREAMDRKTSVAQLIIERLGKTTDIRVAGFTITRPEANP